MITAKNIHEDLIYEVDFSATAGANALSQIASINIVARGLVSGPALTLAEQALSGQKVRLRLASGAAGEVYRIEILATDGAGQTYAADFELHALDFAWSVPDGAGYLSPLELVDRLGFEEFLRLTDDGSGRVDEQAAAAALGDATAIIDGYLSARYALPLGEAPQLLKVIATDLVRVRLHRLSPPDEALRKEKAALALLEKLATGVLQLPPTAPQASASPSEILFEGPERVFSAATLADF